jgi:hypothetical protein
MEVAEADVIKASRHPRFWLAGVENYLLSGSTQRHRPGSYTLTSAPADRRASAADRPPMPPPTITTRTDRIWINPIPGCA